MTEENESGKNVGVLTGLLPDAPNSGIYTPTSLSPPINRAKLRGCIAMLSVGARRSCRRHLKLYTSTSRHAKRLKYPLTEHAAEAARPVTVTLVIQVFGG